MTQKVRAAKFVAESIAVLCPACDEPIPARSGSLFWTAEDFRSHSASQAKWVKCDCGALVSIKIPSRVGF